MIVRIGSKAGVDLGAKASLSSRLGEFRLKELGSKELGIAELDALAGSLSFPIVLSSYAMASLRAESLSGLLKITKLC